MFRGWIAIAVLTGCAPDFFPGTVIPGAGPTIAHATVTLRVRHTDLLPVTVVYPSDAIGNPTGSARAGLVYVQGGLVATSDYLWLADALARQGIVTAIPENSFQLAFFSIDNGRFARDLLAAPPSGSPLAGVVDPHRIAVAGHSLGGVVAFKLALSGGFAAMLADASYADSADDDRLPALGMPSLTLTGRNDCNAKLETVQQGAALLPSPTAFAIVDGMTHYEFTSDDGPDLKQHCAEGIDLATAHARVAEATVDFLSHALSASRDVDAAELAAIPGLQVTSR